MLRPLAAVQPFFKSCNRKSSKLTRLSETASGRQPVAELAGMKTLTVPERVTVDNVRTQIAQTGLLFRPPVRPRFANLKVVSVATSPPTPKLTSVSTPAKPFTLPCIKKRKGRLGNGAGELVSDADHRPIIRRGNGSV